MISNHEGESYGICLIAYHAVYVKSLSNYYLAPRGYIFTSSTPSFYTHYTVLYNIIVLQRNKLKVKRLSYY